MGTINLPPLTQKHQLNSSISRAPEACSPQDMCLGDRHLSLCQALQKWRRRKKKEMLGVALFPQAATPRSGSLWGKHYLPSGSLTRHLGAKPGIQGLRYKCLKSFLRALRPISPSFKASRPHSPCSPACHPTDTSKSKEPRNMFYPWLSTWHHSSPAS